MKYSTPIFNVLKNYYVQSETDFYHLKENSAFYKNSFNSVLLMKQTLYFQRTFGAFHKFDFHYFFCDWFSSFDIQSYN